MLKKITMVAFAATILFASTSCNSYKNLGNATSVGQLSSNPFLQNVAKSVLKNMASTLIQNGMTNIVGKLNLGTSLSSILSTAQTVSSFKNMLSGNYNISNSLIDSNYGSWGKISDVVGFVAKNGSGFKF